MSRPLVIRTTALVVLYTTALLTYRLSGYPGLFAVSIAVVMLGVAWISPFARPADNDLRRKRSSAGSRQPPTVAGFADEMDLPTMLSTERSHVASLDALEIELEQLERRYWLDQERLGSLDEHFRDRERRW